MKKCYRTILKPGKIFTFPDHTIKKPHMYFPDPSVHVVTFLFTYPCVELGAWGPGPRGQQLRGNVNNTGAVTPGCSSDGSGEGGGRRGGEEAAGSHLHRALTNINAAERGRSSTDYFPKALLQTAAPPIQGGGALQQGDYWRCPWPHAAEQGNFISGKGHTDGAAKAHPRQFRSGWADCRSGVPPSCV